MENSTPARRLALSRRLFLASSAAAAVTVATATQAFADQPGRGLPALPWNRQTHRGIRVDDPQGRDLLRNPHRGYRYEMSFNAIDLKSPWQDKESAYSGDIPATLEAAAANYGPGANTTQLYFYLWDYATTALPPQALANIRQVLGGLRGAGFSVVLRFAYDDGVRAQRRYTVQDIQRHIEQLRPIVAEYSDIISVWQAGFIGAWGEWAGSYYNHANYSDAVTAIMGSLTSALPVELQSQMRYFQKREMVLNPAAKDRIGYHNDYFTLGQGLWDYYVPSNAGWQSYLDVSTGHFMDGEMPWDKGQSKDPYAWSEPIDAINAARRLQTLRFNTFSLSHNATVTYPAWKQTMLNAQQVRDAGLPAADGYFSAVNGEAVERTAFEYIRDHLGYRAEAREARWRLGEIPGGAPGLDVELDLVNSGFAAPKRPMLLQAVLLDQQNQVLSTAAFDGDWKTLQPSGRSEIAAESKEPVPNTLHATLPLPASFAGRAKLGVRIADAGRGGDYAVRLANSSTEFLAGTNIVAGFELASAQPAY